MDDFFYCDATRLLQSISKGKELTGIDRVNLAYSKWTKLTGGKNCVFHRGSFRLATSKEEELIYLPSKNIKPPFNFNNKFLELFKHWQRDIIIPKNNENSKILFNVSHGWLDNPLAWLSATKQNIHVITMIHDLIPINFPEYARPGEYKKHLRRIKLALSNSKGIIANSEHTRAEINFFIKNENIKLPPILTIPLGHEFIDAPIIPKTNPSGRPYFVTLGTIEPRKNHLLLLNIWRELVASHGNAAPDLVIIGKRGWECEQVIDFLERSNKIIPHIIEINNANDMDVLSWIIGSRALLFPSFSEGFGMPLQEALALKVPAIVSSLSVFREIAGDIPEYCSPIDGISWLKKINDYMKNDSILRNKQLLRIINYKHNNWNDHFHSAGYFLNKNK
jgi:glycosyltransferase involved in cell wall biosynthesis